MWRFSSLSSFFGNHSTRYGHKELWSYCFCFPYISSGHVSFFYIGSCFSIIVMCEDHVYTVWEAQGLSSVEGITFTLRSSATFLGTASLKNQRDYSFLESLVNCPNTLTNQYTLSRVSTTLFDGTNNSYPKTEVCYCGCSACGVKLTILSDVTSTSWRWFVSTPIE